MTHALITAGLVDHEAARRRLLLALLILTLIVTAPAGCGFVMPRPSWEYFTREL